MDPLHDSKSRHDGPPPDTRTTSQDADVHRTAEGEHPIEPLLELLCLEGLEPQQWRDLADELPGDPAALRRYIETVHLRQLLQEYGGQAAAATALADSPLMTAAATTSRRDSSLTAGQSGRRFTMGWWQLALATSVALFLGLAGGFEAGTSRGPASGNQSLLAANGQGRDLMPTALAQQDRPLELEDRLGRITGLSPNASSDGLIRSLQVGDQLRRGEVVQLTQGVMQIGLADGANVLVEGPAEFSVMDSQSVFVRNGRIVAKATGPIRLQTSVVLIECHDAEAALVADGDQMAEIYNFSGISHVHANRRRGVPGGPLKVLKATEGLRVAAGDNAEGLRLADAGPPSNVYRSWDEVNDHLDGYEQLVLAAEPLAYWPLHRVRLNRRVLDLTQNGYDGQAIGNWPKEFSEFDEPTERGAFFDGESYIEPDRKPPISLRNGFTVESWVRVAGGPEYQSIFTSRWVFGSQTPAQQCFGFTLYAGKDDQWEFWSGSGEYGKNWQELASPHKLVRNQWTHVVATFTPDEIVDPDYVVGTVCLYVNGELACSGEQKMSLTDFEWPARIGAAEFVPRSLASWLFRGHLRDVAVYDYVVPTEKIKLHCEVGSDTT